VCVARCVGSVISYHACCKQQSCGAIGTSIGVSFVKGFIDAIVGVLKSGIHRRIVVKVDHGGEFCRAARQRLTMELGEEPLHTFENRATITICIVGAARGVNDVDVRNIRLFETYAGTSQHLNRLTDAIACFCSGYPVPCLPRCLAVGFANKDAAWATIF